jgi:hypothetical protein
VSNNDRDRIWRWRKVDILFVVAIGLVVGGALMVGVGNALGLSLVVAGLGAAGIPITQRGDKVV